MKEVNTDSRLTDLAQAIYQMDAQINGMDGLQKRAALWRSMSGFPLSDRFGNIRNAEGRLYSYMTKEELLAQKDVGFGSVLALNILTQPYSGLPDSYKRECERRAGSILQLMDNSSSFYKLFLESTASRMDLPDSVYQKDMNRCIQALQKEDEYVYNTNRPNLDAADQRRQHLIELTAAVEWLKKERQKDIPDVGVDHAMQTMVREESDALCTEAMESLSGYVQESKRPTELHIGDLTISVSADPERQKEATEPEASEGSDKARPDSPEPEPVAKDLGEAFTEDEPVKGKNTRNDFKGVIITVNGERVMTKEQFLEATKDYQYEFLQECNKFLMDHSQRPVTSHCRNEIVREMINCSIDSGMAAGKYWEEKQPEKSRQNDFSEVPVNVESIKKEPVVKRKEETEKKENGQDDKTNPGVRQREQANETQQGSVAASVDILAEKRHVVPEEKENEQALKPETLPAQGKEKISEKEVNEIQKAEVITEENLNNCKETENKIPETRKAEERASVEMRIERPVKDDLSKEDNLGNATAVFYQVKHRVLDNQAHASESFYLPMSEADIQKEQMQAIQSGEEIPEERSSHLIKMSRFTGRDGREYTNYELDGRHAEEEDLIILLSQNPSYRAVMVEQSKVAEYARTHRPVQKQKSYELRAR